MEISDRTKTPPRTCNEVLQQILAGNGAAMESRSFATALANTFAKCDIALRARLLGRLLGSVGPLALAVVGGGAFAKYVRHARWPEIPVSFEDAARATSRQVYDLARYVEQSNPRLVESLLVTLSRTP